MAQQHKIDGTNINYISTANWSQPTLELSLNLIQVHGRYRVHTWKSDVMTVGNWDTLQAKRNTIVSITTTDPDDPTGDYVDYYNVRIDEVSHGGHDSLNVRNAEIKFQVLV